MSSTRIPVDGNKSPEYKALQGVYGRLSTLFALDPVRVATKLFESGLIPNPPRGNEDSSNLVTSIVNHVNHKAIDFYKFLGVFNTLGTDADSELSAIHAKFVDVVDDYIKSRLADGIKVDAAFLSFSRRKRFETSINAREFTGTLYHHLNGLGCNPWMDAEDLGSGDYLSVTIFKTLQQCKAIVPIVTRGYAQSLWCMRELYYAKLTKSAQLHPVVIEDGWQSEDVGKWLEGILGEVKYITVHEQDVSGVALKVAKALEHNPHFENVKQS